MRYPRSFLGLLIAAFLLVTLPLMGTLLYSAWHTERLTEQSRIAVSGAAAAARASRSMLNRIGSIERLALQLTVLQDPQLRADFVRAHTSFKQVASGLAALPLDDRQRAVFKRTIEREQALFDHIQSASRAGLPAPSAGLPVPRAGLPVPRAGLPVPRAGLDARRVREQAGTLVDDAYEVLSLSYFVADREVERLGASADEVHRRLMVMLLIAIALALAAALVLTRIIARPIAEIDSAIRQLGSADFERPIFVNGPADLHSLGERLDWLRLRLTELEAQKNRFLRHLSHDLKTPLAALREGTELLNDQVAGPLAPPQLQVVAIMRDNSVKLQRLIEELLGYQRALHAASGLQIGALSLEGLLRQSVRSHQLAAQAKAQRVELDVVPLTIWADAAKLRSVIDNLLGNAVKFAPPGGDIRIRMRESEGQVTIDMHDSGPGVPVEEREAIFEAFFRGRAGAFGRAEGTGLGLAIAREFTEAHGGRIQIIGSDRGGHFRVTLPVRPATRMAEAA